MVTVIRNEQHSKSRHFWRVRGVKQGELQNLTAGKSELRLKMGACPPVTSGTKVSNLEFQLIPRGFFSKKKPVFIAAVPLALSFLFAAWLIFQVPVGSEGWIFCLVCVGVDVTAIAILVVLRRGLSQPMVTFHNKYLIYRKSAIPWSRIEDVSPLQVGSKSFVGLALTDTGPEIVYLSKRQSVRTLLAKKSSALLAKYGALIIPHPEGLSVSQFCQRAREVHEKRRASTD